MDHQALNRITWTEPFVRQGRVILAIMLRDIRTRFFGHGLGFLVAIAWPLAHILVLLAIYGATGRTAPYGDSAALFFATGLAPFMAFSYSSRYVIYSVIMNRPLLAFPVVKITDILFARVLLEALGSCLTVIILIIVLDLSGVDVTPPDPVEAALAFASALLLGASYGIVNGIIAMVMPTWATVIVLVNILLYLTSGILFVPDALPEQLRTLVAINPALHLVQWMRAAYYEGYGTIVLSKPYLFFCALSNLFCGLLAERVFKGLLLASK